MPPFSESILALPTNFQTRRWAAAAGGLLLWLSAAGAAAANGADQPLPSSLYTRPQTLVAVAPRRKLNALCLGVGKPVVLLDAGAGFDMLLWRHVQGLVAKETRVCSYDRVGFGFSDGSDEPLDANHAAEDIHRLVQSNIIGGPVVYVGHSIAGLYAAKLASTRPEDIAGAVLVDPAFVGQFATMTRAFSPASRAKLLAAFNRHLADLGGCLRLARSGALAKPVGPAAERCVDPSGYPEPIDDALRAELSRQNARTKFASAMLSEYSSLLARNGMSTVNDRQIGAEPIPFGTKPLLVLTHGNAEALLPGTNEVDTESSTAGWRAGHARLARSSTRGELRTIPDAGHFIQLDDPQAVARAIAEVVAMIRAETGR